MKIYHIIMASIIVVGLVGALTVFGGEGGLLYDMRYASNGSTSYNENVNLSRFTAYDYRTAIDQDVSALHGNLIQSGIGTADAEQNIFLRFWSGVKDLGNSFTTSYKIINQVTKDLGLPGIVLWLITTILVVFILVRTIGAWFFNK